MSKEKLKAAFKMFDKDNSGTISKELRSYFVIVDKYIIFKLKGVSCKHEVKIYELIFYVYFNTFNQFYKIFNEHRYLNQTLS